MSDGDNLCGDKLSRVRSLRESLAFHWPAEWTGFRGGKHSRQARVF